MNMATPPAAPAPDVGNMLRHLLWLVAPARDRFPGALVEIAWDNGATGEKNQPKNASLFGLHELDAAAAHAEKMNTQGRNVYVGVTLKKPETPRNKRTKASDFYVGTNVPADVDENAEEVAARLKELGAHAGMTITTGRTPDLRQQKWHLLIEPCDDPIKFKRAFENLVVGAGADRSATGLNRLMRLGGSVSFPPGKKRAKGYVVEQTTLEIDATAGPVRIETFLGLASAVVEAEAREAFTNRTAPAAPRNEHARAEWGARSFFRDVNDAAMKNLPAWVPAVFGADAQFQEGTGGYRIKSERLGRKLEEDLSIHPSGIVDFGVHDIGDQRAGKRTPIDVVMEYGPLYGVTATSVLLAAQWLGAQLGVDPSAWRAKKDAEPQQADEEETKQEDDEASTADSPDPLDDLVERTRSDPRAPFTPETLERLAALKSEDPGEFEALRARLKEVGCRVGALDKAIAVREKRRAAEAKAEETKARAERFKNKRLEADDEVADLLRKFNRKYMVVNEAGKLLVYEPALDPVLKRRYYLTYSFEDFQKMHMNQFAPMLDRCGRLVREAAGKVWLSHKERRQFINGVILDPSGKPVEAGVLNLWQGFGVKPRPGSWRLMRSHILKVNCSGNVEHFDFLMGWMARLVQFPAEQGEVAVIMRGGEGTGKGTLAKALLRILGAHGMAISNAKHLTGNFNEHLRGAVLLFADEAFFAGDRAHVGVLKSLITEPSLTIEAKFRNAMQTPNFVHLMMASNEDWVVPASLDARRFFVLEVSDVHANDHAYFGEIWKEMESGGYEAMLNDLLRHDLSTYNPRRVPVTTGLQTQRQLSLPTSTDWWLSVLHRGYVYKSQLGLEEYFDEWHEIVATEVLYKSYEVHAKTKGERHPMTREAFGKFMKEMGCKHGRPRDIVTGEHVADVLVGYGGSTARKSELIVKERTYGYRIGSLAEARAIFENVTKLTPDWPKEEEN